MADYMKSLSNFRNARLQPTSSSFNLDPMAGQNFGEYKPSTSNYGFGGAPASSLGNVMTGPSGGGSWWENINWMDKTDASGVKTQGALGTMIGAGSALTNAYLGMKQYGLAESAFKHQKSIDLENLKNQKHDYNNRVDDRNMTRAASREGTSNPYKTLERLT